MVELRERFARDGFVIVDRALRPDAVDRLRAATERAWRAHLAGGGSPKFLHSFGFVYADRAFLEVVDCPATLPLVRSLIGDNIWIYHSHLDVHPPLDGAAFRYDWHRDGGAMIDDLTGEPPPMLTVKVGFFLTDVASPTAGNMHVVPGSHVHGGPPGPPEEIPPGAVPVEARAGSAVVFDRRLWHSRGPNRSATTRCALFLAYAPRWVAARDDVAVDHAYLSGLDPVVAQLLGAGPSARGRHVPGEADVPLARSGIVA